jgi:hypothetical protein
MERIATVTPFLKILTDVIEFGSWAGSAPGSGSGSRPGSGSGSCSVSGPGSWSGWIKLDGRHMCFARGWLAFRRQLPLPLMAFLADAHQRGVLRQAGATYQFRHLELQRRLATRS